MVSEIFCHTIPLGQFRVGHKPDLDQPMDRPAHDRALCLSVGEETSDSNICEAQRRSTSAHFYTSKKCEHHFGAEGHTLEECVHLRYRIQDLIDNKLI